MAEQLSTKSKILVAARQLFVADGFSGASMGKIAKLAGVNHSLLFHHFGNKEQLWTAVKQSIVEEADAKAALIPTCDQPFKDFLHEAFTLSIRFYHENPDIVRMIAWQRMEFKQEKKIPLTSSAADWLKAFTYYQKQGSIRKALNVKYAVSVVFSVIISAALDKTLLFDDVEDYVDFCVNFLQGAFV